MPLISLPCQETVPESNSFSPESARRSVVFPAPLEPITAASCPGSTENETPRNAVIAPCETLKRLTTSPLMIAPLSECLDKPE